MSLDVYIFIFKCHFLNEVLEKFYQFISHINYLCYYYIYIALKKAWAETSALWFVFNTRCTFITFAYEK